MARDKSDELLWKRELTSKKRADASIGQVALSRLADADVVAILPYFFNRFFLCTCDSIDSDIHQSILSYKRKATREARVASGWTVGELELEQATPYHHDEGQAYHKE